MDQINNESFTHHQSQSLLRHPTNQFLATSSSSERPGGVEKDNVTARKVQKADREKLRRDRLNEQFLELGKVLDPDRPRNDKSSILSDTVQVVIDLTAQVNRLKAEFATLTEEARELTQEKNDLREEKASLKSDIENLNAQYQQRLRTTYPWGAVDHSMVMHPSPYPMPVPIPMPMPHGTIPMHPYPFFGTQNHGVIPNPSSTFVPYANPNQMIEQHSVQQSTRSNVSTKQGARDKGSNCQGENNVDKSEASNDVMTNLELKTPGSGTHEGSSSPQPKTRKMKRKGSSSADKSSSSKCSSSNSIQDSSSSSVVGGGKADE